MAVTLTYEITRNPVFNQALGKLVRYEKFRDFKLAWSIAKFARKYDQEVELAQELFLKMVKQHAKLDEKGNIAPFDGQPGTYEIKEEEKENWAKAIKQYQSIDFEIGIHPLALSKVMDADLSALELNALEPILLIDIEDETVTQASESSLPISSVASA